MSAPMTSTTIKAPADGVSDRDRGSAKVRKRHVKPERVSWSTTIVLMLCTLTVFVPLYITVSLSLIHI